MTGALGWQVPSAGSFMGMLLGPWDAFCRIPTLHHFRKALSGQLPCVPYHPMGLSIQANKPVVIGCISRWCKSHSSQAPKFRILQIGSTQKCLHLCTSPIPKDIGWVLPRSFLLCFGASEVLAASSTSTRLSGGRIMGSHAILIFFGSCQYLYLVFLGPCSLGLHWGAPSGETSALLTNAMVL